MNIMYYVLSAVLMGIAFCLGALTEKHFADEEIKMLKTRKMRPANNIHYYIVTKDEKGRIKRQENSNISNLDFPNTERNR